MRYKNIICKYCGNPATVSTLRKADYCDNCKSLAHNEVSRECYKKNVSTNEFMTKKTSEVIIPRKVSVDGANNMYESELIAISQEYDKLRGRAINLFKKAQAEEKRLTKSGDMLVHKLEFEDMTDEEKLNMTDVVARDRKLRRGWKLTKQTAYGLVSAFELRSATKYVSEARKGARTTRNFQEYLENLKGNREIYVDSKVREKEAELSTNG